MGAGEGAAALGELALPAIPAIMRDVHARRRARSQSEAGPGLDDGDQRSAGAPSLAVVELLGAFPTLLGQLGLISGERSSGPVVGLRYYRVRENEKP